MKKILPILLTGLLSCSFNMPINKIDIGKGGATIPFNIIINKGFTTKDSTDGQMLKTVDDIYEYIVYLIKNNSSDAYPLTGDPILDSITSEGFNVRKNSNEIVLSNVPTSDEQYYYIAVRAIDNNGKDLIKSNPSWTGKAASLFKGKIAVSSSGVKVDSAYKIIAGPSTIQVTINLDDASGNSLQANITPKDGKNNLPMTVSSER